MSRRRVVISTLTLSQLHLGGMTKPPSPDFSRKKEKKNHVPRRIRRSISDPHVVAINLLLLSGLILVDDRRFVLPSASKLKLCWRHGGWTNLPREEELCFRTRFKNSVGGSRVGTRGARARRRGYRIDLARPLTCEVIEVVYRSRCNEQVARVERVNEGETRGREIGGGGGGRRSGARFWNSLEQEVQDHLRVIA